MANNPLVPQGVLIRGRASVIWPAFPALNVTMPYLGKEGVKLTLEGESTLFLPTMTGAATSQEPYMMFSLMIALLKTQPLADAYKQKMETDSRLGDGIVRPDTTTLSPYQITNSAIESVDALEFNGTNVGFMVTVKGTYFINSSMFSI